MNTSVFRKGLGRIYNAYGPKESFGGEVTQQDRVVRKLESRKKGFWKTISHGFRDWVVYSIVFSLCIGPVYFILTNIKALSWYTAPFEFHLVYGVLGVAFVALGIVGGTLFAILEILGWIGRWFVRPVAQEHDPDSF